jgi:KDO2-lipid IV(A) lauroyltransferase
MMDRIDKAYIDAHVTLHGNEHADAAVEAGKGGLAVTGHFGSWELMAAAYRHQGYPLDLLIGHQKNKKVDDLFNDLRKRQGLGLIPLNMALKGVLRAVKKNRLVALLGDQDARRGAGIDVEFFGRPTSTYPGIALFSVKSGAPILCPFIVRRDAGLDHDVYLEPPLAFTPTGDRDEDVKNLTQLHAAMLEAWIRKHPDHWFWGHKRWKSKGLY